MNLNTNFVILSAIAIAVIYMYMKEDAEPKKEKYCAMCAGK